MRSTTASHWLLRHAALLPACIAAVLYYFFIHRYSLNLPISDDYADALHFLDQLQSAQTWQQKIPLFFEPHNGHVTLTNRLIYWAMLSATGEINFRWLQWIGSLNILFLLGLLYAGLHKACRNHYLLLAFLGLMLFQIQWWSSALWAMTSLSNFFVIVFALLTFLSINNRSVSGTTLSLLAALLASWSQTNGLLVWPILALVWWRQERGWYPILGMLLPLALVACLPYMANIATGPDNMHPPPTGEMLLALATIPVAFVTVVGAAFSLDHQHVIPACLGGLVLLGVMGRCFHARSIKPEDFTGTCLLFLLGSCLMIVAGRYAPGHFDFMLQSRYKPYSVLLLVLLGSHYLSRDAHAFRQNPVHQPLLLWSLAILFNTGSWLANLPHAKDHHLWSRYFAETWLSLPGKESLGWSALFVDDPDRILRPFIEQGQYKPLNLLKSNNYPTTIEPINCPHHVTPDSSIALEAREHSVAGTHSLQARISELHRHAVLPSAFLLCGEAGQGYRIVTDTRHWEVASKTEKQARVFINPLPSSIPVALKPGHYRVLLEHPQTLQTAWTSTQAVWMTLPAEE